jgi:hypothetical protein
VNTVWHQELAARRILLLRPSGENGRQVLLRLEGARYALPEVHIAPGRRAVEQRTTFVQKTFGIDAVSLSSVEPSNCPILYEIMEPVGQAYTTPRNHAWLAVDSLVASEFRDCNDFQGVMRAVAQWNSSAEGSSCGPFARFGWFDDVKQWVQQNIEPSGLHLTGRFRQLNARPAFSLIRFETNGPAVWFKAVGEPNVREYSVTLMLAHLASPFLPCLIAVHPEWNGWLAFEAEGTPLLDAKPEAWFRAASDLAELQIASCGRGRELLDAGAHDLGFGALRKHLDPFFRAIDDWEGQHSKAVPVTLSREDLRALSAHVSNAIGVLESTGSPSVLGHLDLNPENLVISAAGTVFLDWAEAFIGHPFLTFQYLLQHYRHACDEDTALEAQLLACYLSSWRPLLSDEITRRALEVAPLVAIFAWATAGEPWSDPQRRNDPVTGKFLRSVTRRMHREACFLSERSMPCPD